MIFCTLRYEIDPDKLAEFETHARFRLRADDFTARRNCIRRYDRSFTRPVLKGAGIDELGID